MRYTGRVGPCCRSLLFVMLAGCGGGAATPPAPSPPPVGTPPIPATPRPPTNLTVSPQQRTSQGNVYDIRWTAPSDASVSVFVVEAGSSSGASDLRTVEAPAGAGSLTLSIQQRGPAFVRVSATNAAGTSDPSNEVRAEDIRDIVEALFLSTGPLRSPSHQPFCQFTSLFPDVVEGFRPGTTVRVLLSRRPFRCRTRQQWRRCSKTCAWQRWEASPPSSCRQTIAPTC